MCPPARNLTLTEYEARRLFRRCVGISSIPLLGLATALGLATVESSLPAGAGKPIAFVGLAAMFGGELYFCHEIGRLASALGQSGARWSSGVWIASKFLAFIAWWLVLLKMRSLLKRTYASEPIPFFPP
jgi:hypothetical protein